MYLKKINLKNKTALVTGAGKGIGKACAIALAEAGADLIIVSRTQKDLDKVSKIIKRFKSKCSSYVCDVTNYNQIKNIINMYLKKINLKNKTALVTGAGKGIGKACAVALAEAGANLVIISNITNIRNTLNLKFFRDFRNFIQIFLRSTNNNQVGSSLSKSYSASSTYAFSSACN